MKHSKIALIVLTITGLFFFFSAPASPQLLDTQKKDQPEILAVRVIPPAKAVSPGETLELTLELNITPGYHINAQKPEDELLIPTSVEFKELPVVEVKEIIFPPAVKKKFKFSEKMLSVYEGQIKVKVRLKLADDFCGSSLELPGQVRYQACNNEACLRPMSLPFKVNLKVIS